MEKRTASAFPVSPQNRAVTPPPPPRKLQSSFSTPSPHKIPHHATEPCSACSLRQSECICTCTQPPLMFCEDCMKRHKLERPWEEHRDFPAELASCFNSLDDCNAFRGRQERVRELHCKRIQVLAAIEDAKQTVISQSKSLVSFILRYQQKKVAELEEMIKEVEQQVAEALNEIKTKIYYRQSCSHNPLVSAAWEPIIDESAFHSFTYSAVLEKLSENVEESVSLTLRSPSIDLNYKKSVLFLKDNCIKRYDCRLEKWLDPVTLSEAIHVDAGSSIAFAGNGNLFVCGGFEPVTDCCWMVHCGDGQVRALAKLQAAKGWVGIIEYSAAIYIFGGSILGKVNIKTCEKYDQVANTWSQLPDMYHARSGFNPCVWENCVFIVGGNTKNEVEMLNLRTETFSKSDFKVPGYDYCVLLRREEDFVLVQGTRYFNVNFTGDPHVTGPLTTEMSVSACPFTAVTKDCEYFFLDAHQNIVALNISNMTYRKHD